jgi:hypothetical protein
LVERRLLGAVSSFAEILVVPAERQMNLAYVKSESFLGLPMGMVGAVSTNANDPDVLVRLGSFSIRFHGIFMFSYSLDWLFILIVIVHPVTRTRRHRLFEPCEFFSFSRFTEGLRNLELVA